MFYDIKNSVYSQKSILQELFSPRKMCAYFLYSMYFAFKNHFKSWVGVCLTFYFLHPSIIIISLNFSFLQPNYPWFDRNSQGCMLYISKRPKKKKWVGKNDGSHTSSKTIVACFTTADLTPALIIPHNVHSLSPLIVCQGA